jgi:hypothetical protein
VHVVDSVGPAVVSTNTSHPHPKEVSDILGHASPAFTMSVYQHLLPSMAHEAAGVIEAAIGDALRQNAGGFGGIGRDETGS